MWPVRARTGGSDSGGDPLVTDRDGPAVLAAASLVVVCTDTSRHVDDAIESLDAGARRVLVEKPMAPTVAEAERLLAHPGAAERVMVAAPLRAHRGFQHFRTAATALGAPRFATIHAQSWLPSWRPDRDYRESYSARADEGGALRDLVHEIDYATVVLGAPRRVMAVLEHVGPLDMEAEQAATLLWTTDSGPVTMRVDYITRPSRRGALVTSAGGSVAWDLTSGSVTTVDAEGHSSTTPAPEDLDRDVVMARQASAAMTLTSASPLAVRLAAGAPASAAEGLLAVRVCRDAQACRPEGAP